MHTHNKRAIFAWCLYDWGIASYPVVMITFVFASYFTSKVAQNTIIGTEQWANTMAVSGVLIAILSPLLGTLADLGHGRKIWLCICTVLVAMSSALLWFAYPQVSSVYYALLCMMIGTVALNVGSVFYNALLLTLTSDEYLGRVSGWGWGMGYFGGLSILMIAFYGFVNGKPSWLNVATYEHVRICGPLVAVWIIAFAWPLFRFVPEQILKTQVGAIAPKLMFNQIAQRFLLSIKLLWLEKNICIFLIAQMIYIDGLNTLFAFGGIYAAGTFQMDIGQVLILGITLNACAGLGSTILSWVNDWIGSKATILISLVALILFGLAIVLAQNQIQFWVFASLLSLFVGSTQSSSRSLMAQLVPKEKAATMFGFYVLSGKVSTFIGPLILGFMTLKFHSQRVGMAAILLFFVIGAGVLLTVKTKRICHAISLGTT